MKYSFQSYATYRLIIFSGLIILASFNSYALEKSKPLISNNLHVKIILKEKSPIFSEANSGSKKTGKAEQFSIFFVFKPGQSSRVTKNGYYRVGKDPNLAIGWVEESRSIRWDHRGCLKFTSLLNRTPSRVYKNLNDLRKVLNGNSQSVAPIAEEPGDVSNIEFSMLLPVLQKKSVTLNNQINTCFEIAYLANNEGSQAAKSNQHNVVSERQVNFLDILFVLDTTPSMAPYIQKTKEIIDEIAKKAIGMREGGVRIGLLAYRDHKDSRSSVNPEYVIKRFSSLTTNLRRVKRILQNEIRVGQNTKDVPEAVFDGLYSAITETRWSSGTGLRVVIVVGDASGHTRGHYKNPMNYSLNQILNLASKNRVRVISLKIVSKYAEDNRINQEQFQKLAQGKAAGDRGSYHEINISNEMSSDYVRRVAASVETEIGRIMRLVEVEKDPTKIYSLKRSERAIILKNLVNDKNSFAETQFSSGWISEKNGNNALQVVPYVFLSFDDLALTLFYMQTAITLAKTTTSMIVSSVLAEVAAQTGEKLQKNRSLKKHYEKRLGLPLPSRMLEFSIEELTSWSEGRRNSLADYIKRKVKLLETHRDDPAVWFTTGGTFKYTFVPLDYFP